jgi:hypothetical protein
MNHEEMGVKGLFMVIAQPEVFKQQTEGVGQASARRKTVLYRKDKDSKLEFVGQGLIDSTP